MQRDGKIVIFAPADLLAALLLSIVQRGPYDDIALLEETQALAMSIGWHPIWDVLLAALAQGISDGWIGRDPIGGYRLTSAGRRHLALLMARPTALAPPALQAPLSKLKRKMSTVRFLADPKPALCA